MHFIGCFSYLYHKGLKNLPFLNANQSGLLHLYHFRLWMIYFRTQFLDQNPLNSIKSFFNPPCAFQCNNSYFHLNHLDHRSFFLFLIFPISINQFCFGVHVNHLAIAWDLQVRYFLVALNLRAAIPPACGCFGFLVRHFLIELVSCCQLCSPCFLISSSLAIQNSKDRCF